MLRKRCRWNVGGRGKGDLAHSWEGMATVVHHRHPPHAQPCPSLEEQAGGDQQGRPGEHAEVATAEGCCVQTPVLVPHCLAVGSFCAGRWADAQAMGGLGQVQGVLQMMPQLVQPLSPAQP